MTAIVPYGMRGLEHVTWDPTVTFCSEGRRFLTYDARVRISRKFRSQVGFKQRPSYFAVAQLCGVDCALSPPALTAVTT
jgi:hypothetical protein